MAKTKETELKEFIECCNNMIASKYVLVDISISRVLKSIADSKYIFNIVAESMLSFNFPKQLKEATADNTKFNMPEEPFSIIAFVFSLLNSFDSKKINITNFLSKYFASDSMDAYSSFCIRVIDVFKDTVAYCLMEENVQSQDSSGADFGKEVAGRISFLVEQVIESVIASKKYKKEEKEMIRVIGEALAKAVKNLEIEYIHALKIAFYKLLEGNKEFKNQLKEIETIYNGD